MSAPTSGDSILKVPPNVFLPHISSENLRTSALMDQNSRQPFTHRHLHIIGKHAYELAVSIYLVTTFPGISTTKVVALHKQVTTFSEVESLSYQFEIHKNLCISGTELGEQAVGNAFYAWIGANLIEGGIEPICKFTLSLLQGNHARILALDTGLDDRQPQKQSFVGAAGNGVEDQENGPAAMDYTSASDMMVDTSPSKRKLSYSNSKDSLVSEPEEAPLAAGVDTMKRRKLAGLPRRAAPPTFN
ncbi:hypothetical protein TWF481_008701 [Arthrobotrys musiformis]|uniref:RNase III domain-containing protein n=1 Tax=Arthrobotrys musiformis TaxID=47236 RepID=A0AAV9W7Z1_9PEZI